MFYELIFFIFSTSWRGQKIRASALLSAVFDFMIDLSTWRGATERVIGHMNAQRECIITSDTLREILIMDHVHVRGVSCAN
jgi:hypothetical protein